MSEQLALGLTALGIALAYLFALVRVSRLLAHTLAGTFGARRGQTIVDEDTGIEYDADDEAVEQEWVQTGAGGEWRISSRHDVRARSWYFLVIFPLLLFLHYQFWDPLAAAFEWVFQHAAGLLIDTFYEP